MGQCPLERKHPQLLVFVCGTSLHCSAVHCVLHCVAGGIRVAEITCDGSGFVREQWGSNLWHDLPNHPQHWQPDLD